MSGLRPSKPTSRKIFGDNDIILSNLKLIGRYIESYKIIIIPFQLDVRPSAVAHQLEAGNRIAILTKTT
jgi:hypothetical protein